MPHFAYKALKRGQVTNGEIEAADRKEALRLMDRQGLQPIKVSDAGAGVIPSKEATPRPGNKNGKEKENGEAKKKSKKGAVATFVFG